MKRITDPSFRYTPAIATDLKKTFARVRRAQRQSAAAIAARPATQPVSIIALTRKAKP